MQLEIAHVVAAILGGVVLYVLQRYGVVPNGMAPAQPAPSGTAKPAPITVPSPLPAPDPGNPWFEVAQLLIQQLGNFMKLHAPPQPAPEPPPQPPAGTPVTVPLTVHLTPSVAQAPAPPKAA